jgi:PTH1 family peptidyl-tRNA hydrolase
MSDTTYLIVGLGNPGKRYEKTRHNIGFDVLKVFAKKHEGEFKSFSKCFSKLAQLNIDDKRVNLLMPQTFMNESGLAVRSAVDYFKVAIDNILIVVDDVSIPLGEFRLKPSGSAGGHNGLKSIETHLGSMGYQRLRVGIGGNEEADLVPHVLGKFSDEEAEIVSSMLVKGADILDMWLKEGLENTMNVANVRI